MILDKDISVKITKRNINHYSIYIPGLKLGEIVSIDPSILQKNSNVLVKVKCDLCNTERTIKYQAYNKNINSSVDYPIYTCDKCSHIKIKNTNIKKYGVDYFSKTPDYLRKFKSTMIERYGVEHALQNENLKNKLKETN